MTEFGISDNWLDQMQKLRAEIERLRKDVLHWEHQNGLLEDKIERLRAIGLELLAVAERLSPAQHSLARAQIDKARAVLEPK